jgi:hypothetical protein
MTYFFSSKLHGLAAYSLHFILLVVFLDFFYYILKYIIMSIYKTKEMYLEKSKRE